MPDEQYFAKLLAKNEFITMWDSKRYLIEEVDGDAIPYYSVHTGHPDLTFYAPHPYYNDGRSVYVTVNQFDELVAQAKQAFKDKKVKQFDFFPGELRLWPREYLAPLNILNQTLNAHGMKVSVAKGALVRHIVVPGLINGTHKRTARSIMKGVLVGNLCRTTKIDINVAGVPTLEFLGNLIRVCKLVGIKYDDLNLFKVEDPEWHRGFQNLTKEQRTNVVKYWRAIWAGTEA